MAEKKIIRGVRIDKSTFVAGQEEQLAAVLGADQTTRLLENGAISGDWLPEVLQVGEAIGEPRTQVDEITEELSPQQKAAATRAAKKAAKEAANGE